MPAPLRLYGKNGDMEEARGYFYLGPHTVKGERLAMRRQDHLHPARKFAAHIGGKVNRGVAMRPELPSRLPALLLAIRSNRAIILSTSSGALPEVKLTAVILPLRPAMLHIHLAPPLL